MLDKAPLIVIANVTSKDPLNIAVTAVIKGKDVIKPGTYKLGFPAVCDPRSKLDLNIPYVFELFKPQDASLPFGLSLCQFAKKFSSLNDNEKAFINDILNKNQNGVASAPTCEPFNAENITAGNLVSSRQILLTFSI